MGRISLCERPVSCRMREAVVHIEDRGFQFADGVYEVWAVFGGRLGGRGGAFRAAGAEPGRAAYRPRRWAAAALRSGASRRGRAHATGVRDGLVYLQVTRGVAPARPCLSRIRAASAHAWSSPPRASTARPAEARAARGVAVITTPETRWARCDIKTIGAAAQRPGQAGGARGGRRRGLVRRRTRPGHRGRAPATPGSSTPTACFAPATSSANILRGVTRRSLLGVVMAARGIDVRGAAVQRWRRPRRRAKPSSQAPARLRPAGCQHRWTPDRRRCARAGGASGCGGSISRGRGRTARLNAASAA